MKVQKGSIRNVTCICKSERFSEYMEFAKHPVAAAILYLGDRLGHELRTFDHQIKSGIEAGLRELTHEVGGLGNLNDIACEISAAVKRFSQPEDGQ